MKEENEDSDDILILDALMKVGEVFTLFSKKRGNDDDSIALYEARRHAFAAALKQMSRFIDDPPDDLTREPYPTKWLRSQLCNPNTNTIAIDSNDTTNSSSSIPSWYPLHWLLTSSDCAVKDIQVLHQTIRGKHAYTADVSPFSVAVSKSQPNKRVIEELLSYRPDAIRIADKDGAYALMYAAAWNENELTMHSLYQSCPSAIMAVDKYGYHAIHYAAYVGCLDVVSYLLEVCPECIRIKNNLGVLPLSAAAVNQNPKTASIVKLMLSSYPEAASITDDEGSLALHKSARFASIDVVQTIYEAFPDAVRTTDDEGLLPMHYVGNRLAISQRDKSRSDNVEVLQFLLEKNPNGEIMNEKQHVVRDEEGEGEGEDARTKAVALLRDAKEAAGRFFNKAVVYAKKTYDETRNK